MNPKRTLPARMMALLLIFKSRTMPGRLAHRTAWLDSPDYSYDRTNCSWLVTVLTLLALLVWAGTTRFVFADERVEIKSLGNTDEVEFLLYAYLFIRPEIAGSIQDRDQSQKTLAKLRNRVNRYHEYIKDRKLDPKVRDLYSNLLSAIDCLAEYGTELDQIDRGILARRQQEQTESSYHAGVAGGTTVAIAQDNNLSGRDTAIAGMAIAAATYFLEESKKKQALDESKRRAIEVASEALKRKMSVIEAREKNTLGEFASKYHWKKDGNGEWTDRFKQLVMDLADRYGKASTIGDAVKTSNAILDAARLVPPASVYDEHRALAAYSAASLMSWAAEKELNGRQWGSAPSPLANNAVKLRDTTIRYAEDDSEGHVRSSRIWALAIGGRFNEAHSQARQVYALRKDDPNFLYRYACLLSCGGHPDKEALLALNSALLKGSVPLVEPIAAKAATSDPNLEGLRRTLPDEFAELVKVKYAWYIEWGLFSDTIRVENRSAFRISNVKLTAKINSTDYADWGPQELTVGHIDPGQSAKWNVKITSRGKDPNGKATLVCNEQN